MTTHRNYWLMKSEPNVYSIDDLKKERSTYWNGVRNFKARNYMKEMKVGDGFFLPLQHRPQGHRWLGSRPQRGLS